MLAKTLDCFETLEVPPSLQPELLVADNGSTDHTREVVRKYSAARIPVRYFLEPAPGKSRALNTSIAAARGEVLLFTDDDVIPAKDWLEGMGRPLLNRECDAAVGRIELGKDLCRPWMTPMHEMHLAVFHGERLELIGANMGFHRSVLERVPGFDVEVGPGALGLYEDTLFSWQLAEAGCRLKYLPDALVVHQPDPLRLTRFNWLSRGRVHGASMAYVMHHWLHESLPSPRLQYFLWALKLRLRCLLDRPRAMEAEGIARWEMGYVREMELCRQYLVERRRPRNYARRGLRKLRLPSSRQTCPSSSNI
jgi:glycosyltransferase involved in cell wall biosynthesis